MKIGIIGAGGIGGAFAKQVAKAGYEVIISNSRGAESLTGTANNLGAKVKAGSVQEAAEADVVFLAVTWNHLEKAIAAVPSWEGRIVIDATNPVIMPEFTIPDLGGKNSSEIVAGWVRGASLVKAFNTYTPVLLASDPNVSGGKRVVFYSGNDDASKTTVAGIINQIGFAGIDLGKLSEGGKLQQFPGGPLPGINLVKFG